MTTYPTYPPRVDIAMLLRRGATYRQVVEELGVPRSLVAATRALYKLPYPRGGSPTRPTPEERARLEEQVCAMWRAGATHEQIREQLGVTAAIAVRIRRKYDIPKPARQAPIRSAAETYALYAEPYGGGHVRWTGPMAGRMPACWGDGRNHNARHISFQRHYGRAPIGYVIPTVCQQVQCLAGPHLTDTAMRNAARRSAR